jgi:hypothetical protein
MRSGPRVLRHLHLRSLFRSAAMETRRAVLAALRAAPSRARRNLRPNRNLRTSPDYSGDTIQRRKSPRTAGRSGALLRCHRSRRSGCSPSRRVYPAVGDRPGQTTSPSILTAAAGRQADSTSGSAGSAECFETPPALRFPTGHVGPERPARGAKRGERCAARPGCRERGERAAAASECPASPAGPLTAPSGGRSVPQRKRKRCPSHDRQSQTERRRRD